MNTINNAALLRLSPYVEDGPGHCPEMPNYQLVKRQLSSDLRSIFGDDIIRDFAKGLLSAIADSATRKRVYESPFGEVVDIAKTRAYGKVKRNQTLRSSMVIGQASWEDISRLCGVSTDLYTSALVYLLIKQGALVFGNLKNPANYPLLGSIKDSAPALYQFIMTDHVESLHICGGGHLLAEHVFHGIRAETHASVVSTPGDDEYTRTFEELTNATEFRTIGTNLAILLRHLASSDRSHVTRIILTLNPDIIPKHRQEGRNPLNVATFGNSLNSVYHSQPVSYVRQALASTIGRPDLWACWIGDDDKRYYTEHGKYATRGSQNRVFGWVCKRLDDEINANHGADLNPYSLLALGLSLLATAKPYQRRPIDIDQYQRLLDTPRFDPNTQSWEAPSTSTEEADNA